MFEDAVEEFEIDDRKKKLGPYRTWIVNCLKEFPSLSGAQVYDCLEEKFLDINVGESNMRHYVNEIGEMYQTEKRRTM